jgi:hypothetical protein
VIFAKLDLTSNFPPLDEAGDPISFGCVRAIISSPVFQSSFVFTIFRTCKFYTNSSSVPPGATLHDLLSTRDRLFEEFATMKRRHFLCCNANTTAVPESHTETNCKCCFKKSENRNERLELKAQIEEQTKLIEKYLLRATINSFLSPFFR